jgi:opacity protein-like surface antigen
MTLASRIALPLAAALLWPLAPAIAADYDPPVVVDQAPEYVPVEVGSGWYLRGDIGYAVANDVGRYTYRTFDGADYGHASFDSNELNNNVTIGGGFGYRFTDWVRSDFTVDGFREDFSGSTSSASPCSIIADTGCRSKDTAEMSAISVMVNGYVDLGTYVGITPYAGAGVGYSYVSWSDLSSKYYCVDGLATCPDDTFDGSSTNGGQNDWRFTYALMLGAAYDITKNWKIDLGYKYRHIDGGDMFKWDSASAALGATGNQGSDGDLSQQEIKIGLRYELW